VAAVKSIRNLRDPRRPVVQAWFLHICKHKVIDHLWHRQRAERPVALDAPPPPDPAQIAETRLRAEAMRRAMEELTEDQRDVLIRRFVLDQALDEVAEGTGRTVGAVKSLQHRALAALQRRLTARGTT
jgi:RNA polymerase sigma-70 factor (ECF subfamily)